MSALEELRRSLASPLPVYVCVGDEALFVAEAVEAVRAAVLSGGLAAFNHAVYSGGEEGAAGVADGCRQVPVMAARRLVELRQVQDSNVATLDALLGYVAAPVDSTVLLISGVKMPAAVGGADRGVRVVNAVKKVGLVVKLDGAGMDPGAFARARARPWNATIDHGAVQALVELGGDDFDALAGNVERCAAFVGEGGTVTAAVVGEVCVSTAEADVWGLTDAIVAGNVDGAVGALHHLLEDGEPPHRLMASIAWQLRQVLLVQDAVRRRIPERDAGVRMPPFKLRAVREMVERRPVSPSVWLEALAVASRRMNSSRSGDRRVLEAFVLGLVIRG
ncbi:MAG: DNA polymerase III subunit delta [Myxococcales bacterium]|nr:DNA polymerase III subunit delta [Myxococcales bacterium]